MNGIRKFRKNKDITKKKINRIRSLSFKIALLMFNFIFATFAWFMYKMTLTATVDVTVSAWKVSFTENTTPLETDVTFELENFYPGMDDFVKNIAIENLGDRAASIEYEIELLKILGTEYTVKQTAEAGDPANTTLYSSTTVVDGKNVVKLLNNSTKFPFEITLEYSKELNTPNEYSPNRHKGNFKITLSWPYELTEAGVTQEQIDQKNTLDTKWGYDIANFYQNLPAGSEEHGIEIKINAIAKQIID